MHSATARHRGRSLPALLALLGPLALAAACGDRQTARDADAGGAADGDPAIASDSAPAPVSTLPAAIRRLPPDSFPFLPDSVHLALRAAACAVPQTPYPAEAHNVVSGELAAAGQTDWAALCARGDSTGIIVVWGGPVRCGGSLAWQPNDTYLQDLGGDRMEFSRALGIASMVAILRRAQAHERPEPPARDHAGLEDIFVEKASIVRFCHDGQWLELLGAD